MRDTARMPQPPTNPPKGHQMTQQGLAKYDQKCQIRAKFGRFWQKNPNFYWRKQKFWYPHNAKTTQAPDALFYGRAWDEMSQKCQYLAQNDQICIFWAKFGHFWA